MKLSNILASVLVIVISPQAFAWSAIGHVTICEIAYLELTARSRIVVGRLMATDTDSRFKSFRDACVWADTVRGGGLTENRYEEHYIHLPRTSIKVDEESCIVNKTCLFTAIRQDKGILQNPDSADTEKWKALKYLGHWIGDIHQPLNVSFKDDNNGRQVYLEKDIGCKKNLYSVWEECIPEDIMDSLGLNHKISYQRENFAIKLRNNITDANRSKWQEEMDIVKWAEESFSQAIHPDVQYCYKTENDCRYTADEIEHSTDGEKKNTRTIEITGAYEDKFHKIVTQRIQAAGVRLGHLLNNIFDP